MGLSIEERIKLAKAVIDDNRAAYVAQAVTDAATCSDCGLDNDAESGPRCQTCHDALRRDQETDRQIDESRMGADQ